MGDLTIESTIQLHDGNRMPVLGLGTWKSDDAATAVTTALDAGYRMIDTSGDYGTEPGVGEGLRRSGLARDRVFVVTKVEEDEDPMASTRDGLRALDLERVDLMLLHRPPENGDGEELWAGLRRVRDEGLATSIGVSNYSVDQLQALADDSGEMPAVNQIEWSPFGWDPDTLAWSRANGVVLQAYSPLSRTERLDDPTLADVAESVGRTPAQVMLRWHLQQGVVPIPKASADHITENAGAFGFALDDDQMTVLDGLNEHYSALGTLPYV